MKHFLLHRFQRYRQQILVVMGSIFLVMLAIPIFTYIFFARDLTSRDTIMNRNNTGVVLLDRNNMPFFTFYQGRIKEFVPLGEISTTAQQAVIAAEDKEFYSHPGFSVRAILRSLYLDIIRKDFAFGGSTITQQLVKNALLTSEKSFLRKYQEIVLSQEIERRYSKQEILEMYLNSVYFGEGAFGIQQASEVYFAKDAKNLTLSEASLLAAILPSPSRLSPLNGDLEEAKRRQENVLSRMLEEKYITLEQKDAAFVQKFTFSTESDSSLNSIAPHFALMVRQELIDRYGEERISRSGFKVKTTLDSSLQEYAEEVVKNQVDRLKGNNVSNGAAVAIDPNTGEILSLVGSKDWYDTEFGKFNIATADRPPGSSFKPIVYAGAFEKRIITLGTILSDKPTTFQGNYMPQNYDRKFRGDVLPRRALANSLNVPAVIIEEKLGVPATLEIAERFGISNLKSSSDYGVSIVLGTAEVKLLEMTSLYGMFANEGIKNDPTAILEIVDKREKSVYTYTPKQRRVLESDVAFLISSILSDNAARAEVFGNSLTIGFPAAVKTGTTEDYKDAWALGYSPSIAVGVWVGNNDNTPMDRVAGSLGAAPIWRLIMTRYLTGKTVETFIPPPGVVQVVICKENGLRLAENVATSSAITEYFLEGTVPRRFCTFTEELTPTPTGNAAIDEQTPTPQPTDVPQATFTPTPLPPTPTEAIVPTITL